MDSLLSPLRQVTNRDARLFHNSSKVISSSRHEDAAAFCLPRARLQKMRLNFPYFTASLFTISPPLAFSRDSERVRPVSGVLFTRSSLFCYFVLHCVVNTLSQEISYIFAIGLFSHCFFTLLFEMFVIVLIYRIKTDLKSWISCAGGGKER